MNKKAWIDLMDELGPGFAEGAAERDATDGFVAEHYPVLRERGVLSALVPPELGGGGASHSTMCAMLRRLGSYDPATALALSMHQHLVAAQLFSYLHGKPGAEKLLGMVGDKRVALVSTGARDWLGSNGSMRRVEGGYRVSARKSFASGALAGAVAITSAPYEHPEHGWQVLHFPVPLAAEGVRIEQDWQAHGMRATGSHTLLFEDVFVPEGAVALSRPRGELHMVWNVVLTVALPLISAAYVGLADLAVARALPLATARRDDPLTQLAVGEMRSDLVLASACFERMVLLANDCGFTPSAELSSEMLALKTHTVEAVQRVCTKALDATGGAGFYRRHGLEQLLRDARAGSFHPLPRMAQHQFTGRLALRLEPVAL